MTQKRVILYDNLKVTKNGKGGYLNRYYFKRENQQSTDYSVCPESC